MKTYSTLAKVTSALVLAVATISFILSYHALQGVASANGLGGWLSYIWPLLVDFSLVVFSLCVVSAHLYSESTWKQWVLVSISTGLTVFYNALYAYPDMLPPLTQKLLIIGLPPIMLFFSFELLMSQLKNGIKRGEQQAIIAGYDTALLLAQNGFTELMQQVEAVKAEYQTALNERDTQLLELTKSLEIAQNPVAYRRQMVLEDRNSGKPSTLNALAEKYNVTVQTIQNDVKALNGSIAR